MLFLRLTSSTCLLRALCFCLPCLPKWLHAISTGLLRAPMQSSRRYIWRRYNEECYFFSWSLPFASFEHSVSVSFSAEVASRHLNGAPQSPPSCLRGGTSGGSTMKNAISSAGHFHLPPSSTPFLSSLSAEWASSYLNGAP